jgi:hypothetical protein
MNDFWTEIKGIRDKYRIRPASTGNDLSRKRIALLVTDCLLKTSKDPSVVHRIPLIESCLWEALRDSTLRCDRLPEEGERKRYGPGGYLAWEKVYTGNQGHGESTQVFVLEIINSLTNPQESSEGELVREEGSIENESSGDHNGKRTHGIVGRRGRHHVPVKVERPALYTAQSHKEGLPGKRGPGMDRKQQNRFNGFRGGRG